MYSSDKNTNVVISRLRHGLAVTSEWFHENYMVLNPVKYHFLTPGFNQLYPDFSFYDTAAEKSIKERILGIVN